MSVFSDFQRMWMMRFPDNSLSSEWEQDVKASLQRHKQKIIDLSKELEQEMLYVDYLEKLITDVEQFRSNGGDPIALLGNSKDVGVSGITATSMKTINNEVDKNDDIGNVNALEGGSDDNRNNDYDDGAIHENNDANDNNDENRDENGVDSIKRSQESLNDRSNYDNSIAAIKSKVEKMNNSKEQGALHHQCIDELTSHIRIAAQQQQLTAAKRESNDYLNVSKDPAQSETPTSFVTVIEVKDSASSICRSPQTSNVVTATANDVTPSAVTTTDIKSDMTATLPSSANLHVEPSGSTILTTNFNNEISGSAVTTTKLNSEDITNGEQHIESISTSTSTSTTTTTTSSTTTAPTATVVNNIAQNVEVKKKIPPRPPPKVARRIGAPVEAPVIMTETPPSPSALSRTTATPPSPSSIASNVTLSSGSTTTFFSRNDGGKSNSLDSNVKPSEILRHKYNDDKLTTVLHKFSHGNIAKSGSNSSSESLINSTNNEEGLAIDSFRISERIKSYESISSLGSDGLKANTIGSSAGNSTIGTIHSVEHHEPYYDTVPIEETDDDVEAEETNRSSKAVSSSLPKIFDRQISADAGGVVGERSSNYMNIDYFLSQNRKLRDSSNESDEELEPRTTSPPKKIDDTKNVLPSKIKAAAHEETQRNTPIRHIISSIITSETFYVECLTKMLHYMKAMRATLTTSRPVISEKEFQTMFFKIDELYVVHVAFLTALKNKISQDAHDIFIGGPFEELAKHIHIYGAFLHNYGQAIDTVKKCGENNIQFKEIVSKIVLNSQNEQLLTLEDLLHKPVARLQKNALVLQDLINETPVTHPDYKPLIQSQKMTHKLLSEFNVVQNKNAEDKALRRLVKNSFIVELADGHRKLRHLFLFNDVIACAKYKASGRDRFEFELKWFISLKDIFIPTDESMLNSSGSAGNSSGGGGSMGTSCVPSASNMLSLAQSSSGTILSSGGEAKENNPVNILSLRSQASTVRDLILSEERDDKKHKSYSSRSMDKYRKKLHDIEAQLVLALPNLIFRLGNKTTNKISTFFLSSQFERNQWIDAIINLQESCNLPSAQQVNVYDLQAWIAACQTFVKTEMGSYLMRNSRDEKLLVGDLHLTICGVSGFDKPSDLFCCVEVDSYGHYFRKASTKTIESTVNPQWNEFFLLELEGCQNMRFLLYEDAGSGKPLLKAEHILKLSRKWLQETPVTKSLKLSDVITLNIVLKFANEELQLCRVPTTKPGPLFGVKFQQVLKREKRDIPFIITACIKEVERRGMFEVGIYRVSGSASDLARLKKAFETNNYEAEQMLKDVDIHSVTGIFKSYLRELPETLFTDALYRKLIDTFNKFSNINEMELSNALLVIYNELAAPSKTTINYILDHLLKVHQYESENKMSLHNLAMVFGPTLLRTSQVMVKQKDQLETSTVDVMAQAGILYCFLQARKK